MYTCPHSDTVVPWLEHSNPLGIRGALCRAAAPQRDLEGLSLEGSAVQGSDGYTLHFFF